MKIEDLSIDTGYSKEQLGKLIAPGERITIPAVIVPMAAFVTVPRYRADETWQQSGIPGSGRM